MKIMIFYFKLVVFLLGFSLLLTNCFKEIPPDTIEPSKVSIKKISFQELKQKRDLYNKIERIEKVFDINKGKQEYNARVNATDNSFTILTDYILETSDGYSTTYTFRIETPIDSTASFENFCIKADTDENPVLFLGIITMGIILTIYRMI